MEFVDTIKAIRKLVPAEQANGKTIGLVPTMGSLHVGHVSLMKAAVARCDFVVVSIFVNPTQFGPSEDFDKYPRDLGADMRMCEEAGVAVVFAPSVGQMYPEKNITWVTVDEITDKLCGASRPSHFRGVTTVCAKLFNIVGADFAFFGQKDAQQAVVIQRMVADLNMPIEIVVCPTVRCESGLAVSSRNTYLSDSEKKDAALLYAALQRCGKLFTEGCRDSGKLIEAMRETISASPKIQIEYINITDTRTLEDIDMIEGSALAAIAAKVGPSRLIDNIVLGLEEGG
jgi:pantoate--beta-alanine ligase